jgi:hypothetical protein
VDAVAGETEVAVSSLVWGPPSCRAANISCSRISGGSLLVAEKPAQSGLQPILAAPQGTDADYLADNVSMGVCGYENHSRLRVMLTISLRQSTSNLSQRYCYRRMVRGIPALTGRGYNPWREPGDSSANEVTGTSC